MVVAAAMPRELRPLVRALHLRRHDVAGLPAWRGPALAAVVVGVGPEQAGISSGALLDALDTRWVLVTGLAGALDTSLAVGELVCPDAVVEERTGTRFCPHEPDREAPSPRRGVLRSVARPATVEDLDGSDGAVALDMETAAIARQCEARGVPWDVRRAVSDRPGTLSPAVGAALRSDGSLSYGALAGAVLRRPSEVVALARLGRGSAKALRTATHATKEALGALGALGPT